jgi:hypothetical protein
MEEREKMLEMLETFLAADDGSPRLVRAYNAAIFSLCRLGDPMAAQEITDRMVRLMRVGVQSSSSCSRGAFGNLILANFT